MKCVQKWMKVFGVLSVVVFSVGATADLGMPFPQFKKRADLADKQPGITPSGSLANQYLQVTAAYKEYKTKFLKSNSKGHYIDARSTDGSGITVSEAHGYGMMLFATMAGYDDSARVYFDGMLKFFNEHKDTYGLMKWQIYSNGSAAKGSATDGDLDIAYALLLAHKQWGHAAYLTAALSISDALWGYCWNQATLLPEIGDDSYANPTLTRPSDWMGGHFRAFQFVDNGTDWNGVADKVYQTYNSLSNSNTGLISDFVKDNRIPSGQVLEREYDGCFYNNAARVPLRFAMDYATSSNDSPKSGIDKMVSFVKGETSNGTAMLEWKSGYSLDGTVLLQDANYTSLLFTSPMGAAASCTNEQELLDAIWVEIHQPYNNDDIDAYYTAINLLSMLVMTGNWWSPAQATNTWYDIAGNASSDGVVVDDFSNKFGDGGAQADIGAMYGNSYFGANNTYYRGGSWWYSGGVSGTVYGYDGTALNSSNMDLIVDDHSEESFMSVKFVTDSVDAYPYAYLGVSLHETIMFSDAVNGTDTTNSAQYIDLSNCTSIRIRARGTGTVRFSFATKLADDQSSSTTGFYGDYGYDLALVDEWITYEITLADIQPTKYSTLADSLAATLLKWSWDEARKNVMSVKFQVSGDKNKKTEVTVQAQEIVLVGMDYKRDFGFDFYVSPIKVSSAKQMSRLNLNASMGINGLALQFHLDKAHTVNANIYNVRGQQMMSASMRATAGLNKLDMGIMSLAAGIYMVRLEIDGIVTSGRFSISR